MMNKRKKFSPEEKVRLLRLYLIEKEPVSDICDRFGTNPNMFYRWQKQFFENGASAFANDPKNSKARKLERKNAQLMDKLAKKDEVIAEIMASHVELKKNLGRV